MRHHLNPDVSTSKEQKVKKPRFSSAPTLSCLLFLNKQNIPAVLHFTPNLTFNLLMNSYFILVFPVVSDSLHSFLHLSACA